MDISIEQLTLRINDNHILNNVNMEIASGELVGYLGPNGAGKSSTIKAITGLLNNYSGKVIIGSELQGSSNELLKSKMGYVPEDPVLYTHLTMYEHAKMIACLYDVPKPKAEEILGYYFSYFNIEAYRNHKIHTVSKGVKQMLLIITALLHDPDVIIFDEPLSGLDIENKKKFRELISSLKENHKTILYSSHNPDFLGVLADRIVVIANGEIVSDVPKNEINATSIEEHYFNIVSNIGRE